MDAENYNSLDEISSNNNDDCFHYMWNDALVGSTEQLFNEPGCLNSQVSTSEVPSQFIQPSLSAAGPPTGYSLSASNILQLPEVSAGVPEILPLASLPATNSWPGDWGFNIHFDQVSPCSKGSSWTYSQRTDKLYVKKDAPCPIKFVTAGQIPYGTSIRAMVVFSQAQFSSEAVHRCFNHAQKDIGSGISLADHVLRSECLQAVYEENPITKQHSVVVTFENPQRGAPDSTYVYSFGCWGSCSGGMNRRPVKIIFTLEHGATVIGRRVMDLRICACPGRDRLSDEKMLDGCEETSGTSKKKRKLPKHDDESDCVCPVFNLIKKKAKCSAKTPPGPYYIKVSDYNLYIFLKQMKNFFILYPYMKSLAPQIKQILLASGMKSSSSGEDRKTSEESE